LEPVAHHTNLNLIRNLGLKGKMPLTPDEIKRGRELLNAFSTQEHQTDWMQWTNWIAWFGWVRDNDIKLLSLAEEHQKLLASLAADVKAAYSEGVRNNTWNLNMRGEPGAINYEKCWENSDAKKKLEGK